MPARSDSSPFAHLFLLDAAIEHDTSDDEHADEHGPPAGDRCSVDSALSSAEHHPLAPSSSLRAGPRPCSPTKSKPDLKQLKPNARPCPVKMMATVLLSRSNSASGAPVARHHYVQPTPPSPAASPAREGGRRGEYCGHRYSRSLSSSKNLYLPAPASSSSSANGNGNNGSGGGIQGPCALPIPPNVHATSLVNTPPKRWTPAELAVHLGNAVSREGGECVVRGGVGGRAFMRMSDEEIVSIG
ncbi:hypothetical protein FB451DRAFT_1520913 [Mycena latifolia]|nr:hypothetical protein FB451DRAFT_1520913 [Mycena latifolia]